MKTALHDDYTAVDAADALRRQTGEAVAPTVEAVHECFARHCGVSGYGAIRYDDGFIGAFESVQAWLVAVGRIRAEECMRTHNNDGEEK